MLQKHVIKDIFCHYCVIDFKWLVFLFNEIIHIYINENTIIPTTNMLKRHENLFKMMQINPIELQNTKLKNSVIEEGEKSYNYIH